MKKVIAIVALCVLSTTGNAQEDVSVPTQPERKSTFSSQRERIYVGGDLTFYMSTWGSMFNISPMAGYKLTKGLMAGAGLTYQYSSAFDYLNNRYENNLFGGRVFLRQDIFDFVFINAELEGYYTRVFDWVTNRDVMRTIPCGNVGLGFKRLFSDNSYYQILIQYDLIGDRFTQYYVYPLAPFSLKLGFVVCLDDF